MKVKSNGDGTARELNPYSGNRDLEENEMRKDWEKEHKSFLFLDSENNSITTVGIFHATFMTEGVHHFKLDERINIIKGLQPNHIELIEAKIAKNGYMGEWLFEQVGKEIGWLPHTVAYHYINHLLKQRSL